ncbi:MAG: hypothetical protein ACI9LU_003167 [Polaribacter sp.]|jgi:hypothetical protein
MVANDSVSAMYGRSFGRGQAAFDPWHYVYLSGFVSVLDHNNMSIHVYIT